MLQIENILDTVSSLGLKVKLALESIIQSFNETTSSSNHKHCDLLTKTLKEVCI